MQDFCRIDNLLRSGLGILRWKQIADDDSQSSIRARTLERIRSDEDADGDVEQTGVHLECFKDSLGAKRDRRSQSVTAVYAGEFKGGEPAGYGILDDKKSGIYRGRFKNGEFSGLGTFDFLDGSQYFGYWQDVSIVTFWLDCIVFIPISWQLTHLSE